MVARHVSWFWVGCVALLVSCAEEDLASVNPVIRTCAELPAVACADVIDLGQVPATQRALRHVVIRNEGFGSLRLSDVSVLEGPIEVLAVPDAVLPSQGRYLELAVSAEVGSGRAVISIMNNDPARREHRVELLFEGVKGEIVVCPTAGLDTTPAECAAELMVELGPVRAGLAREASIIVRNLGTTEFVLDRAELEVSNSSGDEFRLLTSIAADALPALSDAMVTFRYEPRDTIPDQVRLRFYEEGRIEPSAEVRMTAGLADNEPPLAVVTELESGSVSAFARVDHPVGMDGGASIDPEGDPLLYAWTISTAPQGSTAEVEFSESPTARLVPDVMGLYVVTLSVVDTVGQSDDAQFEIEVGPKHRLSVSASWGADLGDVDLHLVREGDTVFGEHDCFFEQLTVDWGELGVSDDDPNLVLDDVGAGAGRETIHIVEPASGRYLVYLHYFESYSENEAWVSVSADGDDGTRPFGSTEVQLVHACDTVLVGTIGWPQGVFEPQVSEPVNACYAGGQP
ncbi:MAG: hypothetical protein VX834_13870 [Myxococcota bacterium]|nr:hypothetical protein [Myxococcota bacterium]